MCGPVGSTFCLGMSIFGVFFLGLLATLIKHDYPYVGEWFDSKGEPGYPPPSLHVQRDAAVHNLWVAAGFYAAIGLVSGLAVMRHRARGAL